MNLDLGLTENVFMFSVKIQAVKEVSKKKKQQLNCVTNDTKNALFDSDY